MPARWNAALRGLLPRAWAADQGRRTDASQASLTMNDIVEAPGKDPLPEDGGGCACALS